MLKQVITYEDFNGNEQTETLYFNLTKTELAENLDLKDRFDALYEDLKGPKRDLSAAEVSWILDLVKTMMRLSYGERSEDGKRFAKSEQIWNEFTQTAVYDAFLFSLFETPDKAVSFLLGILPQDLRAQAELEAQKRESENARSEEVVKLPATISADLPAFKTENRPATTSELTMMPEHELADALEWNKKFDRN